MTTDGVVTKKEGRTSACSHKLVMLNESPIAVGGRMKGNASTVVEEYSIS